MDDTRIIYPAGQLYTQSRYNIVCYSLQDKSQTYFHGVEGYRGFSCMTLSPIRKFLAVGLKGDKPAIVIYDTMSQKKKRTLIFNDAQVKEWVSIAFGPNNSESKTLVSLSGGAEAYLCYWQVDQQKCLVSVRMGQNILDILEVSFHPDDLSFITCIGKQVFKCFRFSQIEDSKQYQLKSTSHILNGAPSELSQLYTCHTWVHNDLVVCTSIGEIFQCDEQGEFKKMVKQSPNVIMKGAFLIEVIQPMQRGFVCGGDNSTLFIYSAEYELLQQLQIKSMSDIKNQIRGISLTPISEETIIVTLSSNLIYSLKIKQDQIIDDQNQFELVSLPFHSSPSAQYPINGMDICVRRPLIVTCGSDKYIRVWNYEEKTIEAYKYFNEEAFCVSMHPSGYHIVVGLSDRLRLMNICVHNNQIKQYREIVPFRQCKEVKFSNGGQYFAAVNAATSNQQQVIHIYKFYNGDNPQQLIFKGHTGKIRCIQWSKDDTLLASCGQDGMVCTWKVSNDTNGQRIVDIHQKNVQFSCVTLTNDSKLAYAVGSDRNIREVTSENVEIKRNVDILLSQIAFPSSNKLLFAGVCDEGHHSGAIRCYKFPFIGPVGGQFNEYQAHDEKGIDRMRVTSDDQFIITSGRDGIIIVYEIKDKDARGLKLKEGYSRQSDEIIVTRADIEDIKNTKDACNTSLQDYNAPQNIINISSKEDYIKQLQEKLSTIKQQSRQSYESLAEKKREDEKKFAEELKQLKDQYEAEIQELDQNQQTKINKEAEKYESNKHKKELDSNKHQNEQVKMQKDHQEEIKKLEREYDSRLSEDRQQRERLQKEFNEIQKKYKDTLIQIEKETQSEIVQLKKTNEDLILEKTDQGLKAKSEVSMNKKKIQTQLVEEDKLNEKIKDYKEQKEQLKQQNLELKMAIDEQLKQITDQDKTIGEKERKIYELKKRSQELEKFKFVLDHKIKELKRDIGPREEEINRMKEQTNKMDQRLKNFAQLNNYLGNVVDSLDSEQKKMKDQIKSQRQQMSYYNVRIKKFKDLVYQAVQYILDYDELKAKAQTIFHEFCKSDVKPVEVNIDIQTEYQSQKQYLEKSVEGLKAMLQTDEEIHKAENIRIMRGNVALIAEIGKLRNKKKDIKQIHQSKQTKQDLDFSNISKNNIKLATDDEKMNEKKRILEQQMIEKQTLEAQIEEIQAELSILN